MRSLEKKSHVENLVVQRKVPGKMIIIHVTWGYIVPVPSKKIVQTRMKNTFVGFVKRS